MVLKRYKHDWLIAFGIIFVLLSIYGTMIYENIARIREETLIYELRSLRMAVATYSYINGKKPKNMDELAGAFYYAKNGTKKLLVPSHILKKGLKDPFGNAYMYDEKSGWVTTSTEKYKDW